MSLLAAIPLLAVALAAGQPANVGANDIRLIQARYADCVLRLHPKEAHDWAWSNHLPTNEQRKAAADARCMPAGVSSFQLDASLIEWLLADAIVRAEFNRGPMTDLDRVPPLAQPQVDQAAFAPKPGDSRSRIDELAAGKARAEARVYFVRFAECVVRANPAAAYRILQAVPDSAEESTAFGALAPAMDKCLEHGRSLQAGKALLRGVVARNYYRLAIAPRMPVQGASTK